jgi:RCC1 and BTB domain-containing protein
VLVVWGDNSYGQLGLGDDASHIKYEPSPVALISCMKHVITIVSAGAEHSLAVSNAGLAFSWGNAANGRLGQGLNRNRAGHATPTIIDRFKSAGLRVSRVSAGAMHSLAVTDNGHVFSWGWAKHGILGNGCKTDQGTPQEVSSLKSRGVWDVVAGDTHSVAWCSISHGGQLYTWGGNFYGQLGHGHEDALYIPKVVKALAGKGIGVVHVATGKRHTVIATTQGVYTCGYGVQGQLGLGSGRENVCSPTMVGKLRGRHIICVAAGKTHSVAVTHTLYDTPGDVEVWSWGDGDHGQLGHGDLKEYCEPRQIQVVAELSNPPPQYSTKVSHGAITQATINRREADHRMKVLEHCHAANDDKMAESVVHSINRCALYIYRYLVLAFSRSLVLAFSRSRFYRSLVLAFSMSPFLHFSLSIGLSFYRSHVSLVL